MGRLRVRRKGYWRKAYTRKDGVKVKRAWVPPTTYEIKDRGEKGRTPPSKQWARFETHTGWKKSQPATVRRRRVLAATDRRKSMANRYLEAGRMMLQLANVTTDRATEEKARADSKYFFAKSKEKRGRR